MTLPVPMQRPSENAACRTGMSVWRKPTVWVILAAFVVAGLALNWNWLVAVGALPILFGVVPCLAMCAFHLCSRGKSDNADSVQPTSETFRPQ